MRRFFLLIPVLVATLAGGCTPMRWEHPSFGPDEIGREAGHCRQQAWAEAQRQSFMFGSFAGPRYFRGRDGRFYVQLFSDFHERQLMEMQLNDFCMRNKGFALVPAT